MGKVKKEREQKNFIKVYRDIVYAIGLDNAIVLGQLIGCREMFDTEWFFQQNAIISYYTGLSNIRIKRAIKTLEDYNLILVKRHCDNNKNYYKINTYNVNLIHKVDAEKGIERKKNKARYEKVLLKKGWYFDYIRQGLEQTQFIKPEEQSTEIDNFEFFNDESINVEFKGFFRYLSQRERKIISKELSKPDMMPVRIYIATYIQVYKVMMLNKGIKKPLDFDKARLLISKIKTIMRVARIYDYEEKALIPVLIQSWKWLFENTKRIIKSKECDYSIFLYTNKEKWQGIEGSMYSEMNWLLLSLIAIEEMPKNKTYDELLEDLKKRNKELIEKA